MLTFSRFETFEQVEAFYNRIKPVREDGYSTSRNIRPIGDRSRKGERIIKVNNNTYALSEGTIMVTLCTHGGLTQAIHTLLPPST